MTAVNVNLLAGDDSNELLRLGSVGVVQGAGGNDTLVSVLNGVAPGSALFGNKGNDYLESKGIGDTMSGGQGNDYLYNDAGASKAYGDVGEDTFYGDEGRYTVEGGVGNDLVKFREDANLVLGGEGNDTILGGEGNDTFAGGAGNDYIVAASAGNKTNYLFGNAGADSLFASTAADSMFGGAGNDYVSAGGSSNANNLFLGGDKGADTLAYAGSGAGVILDGDRSTSLNSAGTDSGADVFFVTGAGVQQTTVFGGAGNDSVYGGFGKESKVFLGQGNDYGSFSAGTDNEVYGDLGADSLNITATGKVTVYGDNNSVGSDGSYGADYIQSTTTGDGVAVIFGDGNDTLGSSGAADTILLTGGSQIAFGGGGNDYLSGGGAGNTLIGGAGNDIYVIGAGDKVPFDSLGINTYVASSTGATDTVTVTTQDSFTGGATFFINDANTVVKSLTSGGVIASAQDDVISIGTATGLTSLGGGNDRLTVTASLGSSADIQGGDGNDTLAFTGTDINAAAKMSGGAGNDSISFTDSSVAVTGSIDGGAGDDTFSIPVLGGATVTGSDGVDLFDIDQMGGGAVISAGAGDEFIVIPTLVTGGATVKGDDGNDIISVGTASFGSSLAVTLDGGLGDDFLRVGSSGKASLSGGAGNDTLISSFGQGYAGTAGTVAVQQGDYLSGGAGIDVYVFGGTNKLGFIGGSFTGGSTVDAFANNFVGSAGAKGTDGTSYFNNTYVDTISEFTSGQDKLYFNSSAFGDGGTFTGVAKGFAGNQATGGSGLSSASSVGIVGAFGSGLTGFGTNLSTINSDMLNGGTSEKGFVYDTAAGALYFNTGTAASQLVAIFPQNTPLVPGDLVFGNFSSGGGLTLF